MSDTLTSMAVSLDMVSLETEGMITVVAQSHLLNS